MNALLISDLHLTSNLRDEYRWKLFPWLAERIDEYAVKYLCILGDLTEAKDYHSARLVNRIVDNLLRLFRDPGLIKTYILRGNHDGIDPACAYFRFLGQYPSIHYVDTPWMEPLGDRNVLMLPHTTDPVNKWKDVGLYDAAVILMHATIKGAVAENDVYLDGIPAGLLRSAYKAKIYSGDVHVPQTVGPVEYVGAPYPIKFGDKFKGRAVLLEDFKKATDLWYDTIQRLVITVCPTDKKVIWPCKVFKGDQVKVRIRLAPHEYVDWQRMKKNAEDACAAGGLELCSIELERVSPAKLLVRRGARAETKKAPQLVFEEYCKRNDISSEVETVGNRILVGIINHE